MTILNWDVENIDFDSTFLYSKIDHEIYIKLPAELTNNTNEYGRLLKSLYDLKQTSKIWAKIFYKVLEALEFKHLNYEPSIFSRFSTRISKTIFIDPKLVIIVYVDDLMLLGKTSTVIQQFKTTIGKQFNIKDLEPTQNYLKIEISRDRTLETITLSQEAYLKAVLRKFGIKTYSPRSSPFSDDIKLKLNDKNFADQAIK